jgi:large subunit ribosomal protein L13
MNTTVRMKAGQITKDWHVIDAAGRPLGRVATEAATLLRGKHKPTYEPHLDGGDFVIVVNAAKVVVSGTKSQSMTYYRHSGYPGGLKSRTFAQQIERFPDRVIERAVHGMLPKGSLGQQLRKHLKVYAGPDHPHVAQVTGSDRARARRDEAEANGEYMARVIPGFRPLPEPAEPALEPAEVAPATVEAAIMAEPAPTGRRRRGAKQAEPAAEAEVSEAPAATAEAPAPGPSEESAPRRRRARKAASAEDAEE